MLSKEARAAILADVRKWSKAGRDDVIRAWTGKKHERKQNTYVKLPVGACPGHEFVLINSRYVCIHCRTHIDFYIVKVQDGLLVSRKSSCVYGRVKEQPEEDRG
jgi:hypothetical protein